MIMIWDLAPVCRPERPGIRERVGRVVAVVLEKPVFVRGRVEGEAQGRHPNQVGRA